MRAYWASYIYEPGIEDDNAELDCGTRKRKMHRRCTRGGRYLRVKREIAKLEPGEELALDALDELQIAARDGHLVRVRLGLGLSFELGLGFSFLLGFGLGLV